MGNAMFGFGMGVLFTIAHMMLWSAANHVNKDDSNEF